MAEKTPERPRRVDVGFAGGQTLTMRLTEDAFRGLRDALASDRSNRWHEVESEDDVVTIDLSQVVYVRRDQGEPRVGFRGA
jgi:hypothetical protein